MKPTPQADDSFLRRILFLLISCAAVTGGVATYAAASASQTGLVNIALPL